MATLAMTFGFIFAAFSFGNPTSILLAALGLGLVIFVHELGHFAVAKWCGVRVERFSIGFGPVIWSFIRGETEYALSLIPFGGYVKMLGQDDVDPNQMTNEDIARDPRSYTAKSVPQRMAIISAGVIMNMLTAPLFFAAAYGIGTQELAQIIGHTSPGSPAWTAGLQPGDRVTEINGYEVRSFSDISKRVILSGGSVELKGVRLDGTEFETTLTPQTREKDAPPIIGVAPAASLNLRAEPVRPGFPVAELKNGFQPHDVIVKVGDQDVQSHAEFERILAAQADQPLDIVVERAGKTPDAPKQRVTVTVPPTAFLGLGLQMDIGQVAAIQKGSPAEGQLEVGDKITHVISGRDGTREVGLDLNPLDLPDYLAGLHGESVTLKVQRQVQGAAPIAVEVVLRPENRPGWIEHPLGEDSPVSVPAIGVAFHVLHDVLVVKPDSPAAGKVKEGNRIIRADLVLPDGAKADGYPNPYTVNFGEEKRNWPFVFWLMQQLPQRTVKLTLKAEGETQIVELKPQPVENWYSPERGLAFEPVIREVRATNPVEAISLGLMQTRETFSEIYLTLYNLFTGGLSVKGLRGPLGIAEVAYTLSNEGLAPLLAFLGYISVNLAVLNFLPIPLLDGGHMLFLIYEGIRGRPAHERVMIGATYIGLAFVLSLLIFVIYLDVVVRWLNVG